MTLVAIPADRCPACGAGTHDTPVEQPALLRHGGYGATRRTVLRSCRCGWMLLAEVSEVWP